MKIALIIENSQAAKSGIVHDALKSVAEPLGLVLLLRVRRQEELPDRRRPQGGNRRRVQRSR